MNNFREIAVTELENVHKLIGEDWMLICTRDNNGANAMTASWGALGELWGKHVAFCFIRPQRYTYELAEAQDKLSLCFFDESYRAALKYCGSHSGRNENKLDAVGMSAYDCDGTPIIKESRLVIICRKLYADDINENSFLDKTLLDNYKARDYHRMYILEIEKVLVRK